MTLTIHSDLRPALGPVRDQGRRPTCLAFAASDVHRHARQQADWLCVEWLYYHSARRAGTGPHCGTTLPHTRDVLRGVGQPVESVWPYSVEWPDSVTWQPPASVSDLLTCESHGASDLDELRRALRGGRPAVVGVFLSDAYRYPMHWTRIGPEVLLGRDQHQSIDPNDGHAMVAVGQGQCNGEAVILLRNSWGPRWGHEGHAWVREDCLAPRLVGAFVVGKGESGVLQSDASGRHTGTRLA